MRAAIFAAVASTLISAEAWGQSGQQKDPQLLAQTPTGAGILKNNDQKPYASVGINSQPSLTKIVGGEFDDWAFPRDLLPHEFPGLTHISGPYDPGVPPKAVYDMPVVLKDKAANVDIAINCYHMHHEQRRTAGEPLLMPWAPSYRTESNYQFNRTEFHGLPAATAGDAGRDVFVFRLGEDLFRIDATGEDAAKLSVATAAVAQAIWKFHHPQ